MTDPLFPGMTSGRGFSALWQIDFSPSTSHCASLYRSSLRIRGSSSRAEALPMLQSLVLLNNTYHAAALTHQHVRRGKRGAATQKKLAAMGRKAPPTIRLMTCQPLRAPANGLDHLRGCRRFFSTENISRDGRGPAFQLLAVLKIRPLAVALSVHSRENSYLDLDSLSALCSLPASSMRIRVASPFLDYHSLDTRSWFGYLTSQYVVLILPFLTLNPLSVLRMPPTVPTVDGPPHTLCRSRTDVPYVRAWESE
ncbi:hypothetical protein BC628DRAFT_812536 [Trametes gibbosa]|nr:hypothetical protein BC628DRAFT_812536 [Trametes gibbosa]